jgi:hypothetical protein
MKDTKMNNILEHKMTITFVLLSFIVGAGTGFGISLKFNKNQEPIKQEPIIVTGTETGDKLADIDLVKIPCSKEYIETNSDMLCRELFCRMQQRGLDSKTSAADCASISNMNNSLQFIEVITKHCTITQENTDDYNKCFDRFNRILTTSKSGQ